MRRRSDSVTESEPEPVEITPTDEWEIHLTVRLSDAPNEWETLENWARGRGYKCAHIVLSRGTHASQPMLTRQATGNEGDALRIARQDRRALQDAGFTITRVKMEAAPWNAVVPQTAQNLPANRYFEHHIKLLLPTDAAAERIEAVAQAPSAHLSRNARRTRGDGQAERFVTQRCFGVGQPEASARLDALRADLAPLGFPILECEAEFVVFDSNLSLDAGWIDTEQ